jgi:DNA-directed RNA polymerase I, II, and III subunit RPABC1
MENDDEGRLYRVFTNVLKMMHHRGYIIARDLPTMTEFDQVFPDRNSMTLSLVHQTVRARCIRVFFCDPPANGKTTMGKQIIERILERVDQGRTNVLLVLPGNTTLTPQARNVIQSMSDTPGDVFVECMTESELAFCPPFEQKYGLGCQWKVVTTAGDKSATSFAKISVNDVIARYFGARPGELLACTRSSETAGFYTQYRLVIHNPQ